MLPHIPTTLRQQTKTATTQDDSNVRGSSLVSNNPSDCGEAVVESFHVLLSPDLIALDNKKISEPPQ